MPYQVVHRNLDSHLDKANWIGVIRTREHIAELNEITFRLQKETGEMFHVGSMCYETHEYIGWRYVDGFIIESLPFDLEDLKWIKAQISAHKMIGKFAERTNALQP